MEKTIHHTLPDKIFNNTSTTYDELLPLLKQKPDLSFFYKKFKHSKACKQKMVANTLVFNKNVRACGWIHNACTNCLSITECDCNATLLPCVLCRMQKNNGLKIQVTWIADVWLHQLAKDKERTDILHDIDYVKDYYKPPLGRCYWTDDSKEAHERLIFHNHTLPVFDAQDNLVTYEVEEDFCYFNKNHYIYERLLTADGDKHLYPCYCRFSNDITTYPLQVFCHFPKLFKKIFHNVSNTQKFYIGDTISDINTVVFNNIDTVLDHTDAVDCEKSILTQNTALIKEYIASNIDTKYIGTQNNIEKDLGISNKKLLEFAHLEFLTSKVRWGLCIYNDKTEKTTENAEKRLQLRSGIFAGLMLFEKRNNKWEFKRFIREGNGFSLLGNSLHNTASIHDIWEKTTITYIHPFAALSEQKPFYEIHTDPIKTTIYHVDSTKYWYNKIKGNSATSYTIEQSIQEPIIDCALHRNKTNIGILTKNAIYINISNIKAKIPLHIDKQDEPESLTWHWWFGDMLRVYMKPRTLWQCIIPKILHVDLYGYRENINDHGYQIYRYDVLYKFLHPIQVIKRLSNYIYNLFA
ncbi:MAG TPA: hypothetical protein VGW78_01910 [Candidatus Babeliales bacterium]|jgi:hypothetical protein|nr:hypothetical protein [Candidatus Babeliales bacterium]